MSTFPNERPLTTHEAVQLAEDSVFGEFENQLDDSTSGANQTKLDYDYSLAGPNSTILLAKPRKTGNLWATNVVHGHPHQGEWLEGATYDPATGDIDWNAGGVQASTVSTQVCNSCGISGLSGKFCNNCGGPLSTVAAPLAAPIVGVPIAPLPNAPPPPPYAAPLQPGQTPTAGAGHVSPPAHVNPNRMEGKPKKEVVVPEGMTRVAKNTGFKDALDQMLAEAEANQSEEQKS
jgi:hypothetical protein